MEKIKLELLAPAKDLETGKAAIDAGADAVYIGADKFGARKAAGNSPEDIKELIHYAHFFSVKVFLTLNTILYDDELESAKDLIRELYKSGLDAVIIQDPALLDADLPPIPIHASTQFDNRSVEKVQFLEDNGVDRVVLARELTLDEIAKIHENSDVELEFFIHGALCVSYSGQCYMSQSIADRSANRGACMQACRSPYNLIDSEGKTLIKNKHLLSIKDLNLAEEIPQLIAAGITSFKIEGRLKDKTYVKNVVAYYRVILDYIIERSPQFERASKGKSMYNFVPDPYRSFNRGSTTYFINGRANRMAGLHSQKSQGKFLGHVRQVGSNYIKIDSQEEISNNDGLCYFDKNKQLCGFKVNKTEKNKVWLNEKIDIQIGASIYRNFDHRLNKILQRDDSAIRKLAVKLRLTEHESGFSLEAIDEEGMSTIVDVDAEKVPARNPDNAAATLIKQLRKSGIREIFIRDVQIKLKSSWFIPIGILNKMRRESLNMLYELRRTGRPLAHRQKTSSMSDYFKSEISYLENVANKESAAFYKNRGVKTIEKAFELKEKPNSSLMTTRYCILYELGSCLKEKNQNKLGAFKQPLYLENNKKKYKLSFDCKKCEMHVS